MIKKYLNFALIYSILAMIFGVFYREFTKFNDFNGKTTLSVIHTHYFTMGMLFFLILALLEKSFNFSSIKSTKKAVLIYNIGLNFTIALLVIRGITTVLESNLSNGQDSMISGFAGLGHMALGVGLIMILLNVKKSVKE